MSSTFKRKTPVKLVKLALKYGKILIINFTNILGFVSEAAN